MPYVTSIERLAREEGQIESLLSAMELTLKRKFGEKALVLMDNLRANPDVHLLTEFLAAIATAKSLDELQQTPPAP